MAKNVDKGRHRKTADGEPDAVPTLSDAVPTPSGAAETPSELVLTASADGAAVLYPEAQRGVEGYIARLDSDRSKENAADALRRIARVVTGEKGALPAQVPWHAINFELAVGIRSRLFQLTTEGAITPGTANMTLSHLRNLLKTMFVMNLIDANQLGLVTADVLKNVKGSRDPRGRSLTLREERSLRDVARTLKGYQGPMLDTAMVLAVGGGLRREELARLPVGALGENAISVIGKGNRQRSIPLEPSMRSAADEWLEERNGLVTHAGFFCAPQYPGKVLTPWMFWFWVRKMAHEAFGNRKPCDEECRCFEVVTGPHDFRRTFATRLLDQGLDIRQVQVLMGHQSPETTAGYDKRDVEALFEKRRNMRIVA